MFMHENCLFYVRDHFLLLRKITLKFAFLTQKTGILVMSYFETKHQCCLYYMSFMNSITCFLIRFIKFTLLDERK